MRGWLGVFLYCVCWGWWGRYGSGMIAVLSGGQTGSLILHLFSAAQFFLNAFLLKKASSLGLGVRLVGKEMIGSMYVARQRQIEFKCVAVCLFFFVFFFTFFYFFLYFSFGLGSVV